MSENDCLRKSTNLDNEKKESFSKQSRMPNDMENNKKLLTLKKLELCDYYPKKMTLSDILVIDIPSLTDTKITDDRNLPFSFLQKLLMFDYRARSVCCIDKSKHNTVPSKETKMVTEFTVKDFLSNISTNIEYRQKDNIHPMDTQMAIFHCADIFMWHYISTKLFFCQYALPFLIPTLCTSQIEYPSWSFVQLQKSWKSSHKCNDQINTTKSEIHYIYNTQVPTVSFIRFEKSLSKSQIMNAVLNNQKHNTFFHRDCKGSSAECHLMDGVAEISWYFPGGKDDDVFNSCVAFTNLHGDAREHAKQLTFLLETSTIFVVLFKSSELNEEGNAILKRLFYSPKPVICLFADIRAMPLEEQGTKVKIAAESRTMAELIEEIVTTLKRLLSKSEHTSSIMTNTQFARDLGFIIDEDNEHCKSGKALAETLMKIIKEEQLPMVKKKYIPIHGDLWQKWCLTNKELRSMKLKGNQSIEQYKSNIEQQKNELRNQQYLKAFPINVVIKTFLDNLQSSGIAQKTFFLKWMEINLQQLTSKPLSDLANLQHEHWTKMQRLKTKGDNIHAENIQSIQKELESLSNESKSSSLSIVDFLREIGQMHEALEAHGDDTETQRLPPFPDIVADLMISGYPIELMDGDTSHIPLKWINAVLDKVIEKLGDKRIFVLSVLGIQSTGKSTLLNAMFGLQFAVSAGSCTRGAFMQLVAMKKNLNANEIFDYVLVVDTEGLRSLELGNASLNHDNELATFVIGIGTLTLINIFGENPSEMHDVLQIVVQAFLRMKIVKLSPSCMFVHQNVGELTSGEKNMEGKRRLVEKLDDMSRTASKQEVCEVNCFSDVIGFDINTHIHYFAHLWEGNPPMAPPNPCYSEDVQKLKRMVFSAVKAKDILKISEFKTRVHDLWNALLAENFVFSFKNTLEIVAYKTLEERYGEWTWKLRESMLITENKLNIAIANHGVENMEQKYIDSCLEKVYEDVKKEMVSFFSEDNDREILIQWQARTQQKVFDVKKEMIEETKRKFNEQVKLKKSCLVFDNERSKYENKLLEESKQLSLTLKGQNLDENKQKAEFEKVWGAWSNDVQLYSPTVNPKDIQLEIEIILLQTFPNESVDSRIQKKKYQRLWKKVNFAKYISINFFNDIKKLINLDSISIEEANQLVKRLTQGIINRILESIKEKKVAGVDYSPNYIHEIIKKIQIEIQDFQSKEKRFVLKNDYKIDLCLMLCLHAVKEFQCMHEAFLKTNDPRTYFTSKKDEYFGIFKAYCKDATHTTELAEFVGNKLKEAIQQAVIDKSAIVVSSLMRANRSAFNSNRSNLEKHILAHLADEKTIEFDKFFDYINFPENYFKQYISQSVREFCWSGESPQIIQVFNDNLNIFNTSILSTISKATENVKNNNGDVLSWLNNFCSELQVELKFARSDLKSVEYQDFKDINFLKEAMTVVLENVVKILKEYFSKSSSTSKLNYKYQPEDILYKQLSGCWVQCPQCRAVCTNTISGHSEDHCVEFHRPQGMAGVKWHKTDNLVTDICSSLVASDCSIVLKNGREVPFKQYRQAGPEYATWKITHDESSTVYWKWFVCRFQTELEERYSGKFLAMGEIPAQWRSIKQSEAIESLQLNNCAKTK